jgi:hypothetical protein
MLYDLYMPVRYWLRLREKQVAFHAGISLETLGIETAYGGYQVATNGAKRGD